MSTKATEEHAARRSSNRPRDVNQLAKAIVDEATESQESQESQDLQHAEPRLSHLPDLEALARDVQRRAAICDAWLAIYVAAEEALQHAEGWLADALVAASAGFTLVRDEYVSEQTMKDARQAAAEKV